MEHEFDFNLLIEAMSELVKRSLATLVPVFIALVASGLAVDYYLADYSWANLCVGVLQFVICYYLVKGLARHSGLLADGDEGPGFGAYFGLSFVIGLGTTLGYLLLVLPGIFLAVRWSLAFPFLFAGENYEGRDGAIGSSWAITGTVFWQILAAYSAAIVLTVISLFAYYQTGIAAGGAPLLAWLAVGNVTSAASTTFALVLGFASFLLLRTDREELTRIFA
jgi:hypothetical protein